MFNLICIRISCYNDLPFQRFSLDFSKQSLSKKEVGFSFSWVSFHKWIKRIYKIPKSESGK